MCLGAEAKEKLTRQKLSEEDWTKFGVLRSTHLERRTPEKLVYRERPEYYSFILVQLVILLKLNFSCKFLLKNVVPILVFAVSEFIED